MVAESTLDQEILLRFEPFARTCVQGCCWRRRFRRFTQTRRTRTGNQRSPWFTSGTSTTLFRRGTWRIPPPLPFRIMAHNGEINPSAGNLNWLAPSRLFSRHPRFGPISRKLFPIIPERLSVGASNWRSSCSAPRPLAPHAHQDDDSGAVGRHESIPDERKGFLTNPILPQEPWDGHRARSLSSPTGRSTGAGSTHGLRPSRYHRHHRRFVVMASETGGPSISTPPTCATRRADCHNPGRCFSVANHNSKTTHPDEETSAALPVRRPYRQWLETAGAT